MWSTRLRAATTAGMVLGLALLGGCAGTPGPGPTGSTSATATAPATGTSTPTGTATPSGPTSTTTPSATTRSTTPTTTPSTSTTATRAPTATQPVYYRSMPIYFVGMSRGSFVLYREYRTIRAIDGRISSAVSAMTRLKPLDPDYVNPWRPASWVWVTQNGATITVDLSADAIGNTNVGSELAERAVQQLVYTATAAAHVAGHDATTVIITINGKPADAWGVLRLGTPMARAAMASVQAHVWVTSPQEGDSVPAGKVSFTGYGTSFEATFNWQVTTTTNQVVAHGTAMGGTMGTFGTVRFSATLKPGTYIVRLATDDPSGGAAGGPAVDTKRFTVR